MGINPRRFLWPLPEHLLCPACKTTLDEPVYICEARHVFCSPCLREKGFCSICHGNSLAVQTATEITEELGDHWLCCIDPKCPWIGPMKDQKAHQASCDFRVVVCELCQGSMRHNERAKHLSQVCPETRVVCCRGGENCGGNGRGIFYRKNSSDHDNICSNYNCYVPGCPTFTTFANLPAHESTCYALRQAVIAAHQQANHARQWARVHQANASCLTDALLKHKAEQGLLDRAKFFYPQVIDAPVSSDYHLKPFHLTNAQLPPTPCSAVSEELKGEKAAGEGGVLNSVKAFTSRSISQPSTNVNLAGTFTNTTYVEGLGLVGIGEEASALKKRKLSGGGGKGVKTEPAP